MPDGQPDEPDAMPADLTPEDRDALLALVEETAGLPDLASFREVLFRHLHRAFPDMPFAFLVHRAGGRTEAAYSREPTSEEVRRHVPAINREQAAFMENLSFLKGSVGIATRDVPAPVRRTASSFQVYWPHFGVQESLAALTVGSTGARGFWTIALDNRRPQRVERAERFLANLLPYLTRTLDGFDRIERLGARASDLETLAAARGAALLVDGDGRVEWMSPQARALLVEIAGTPDPPPWLLEPCARLHRTLARDVAGLATPEETHDLVLPGRTIRAGWQLLRLAAGARVLVTLEDLAARRRAAFEARCEAIGLTAREREVVEGVVRGLENKQIARELRISIETVKNHLKRVFERAGVESRAELVRELLR